MIPLAIAVTELTGKKGFTVESDGTVTFFDGSEPPDPADVLEKWEEMKDHYAEKRRKEYPSVGDQLDMLMKDMKNGTKTHQTTCEAVKTKYPKG